MKETSKKIAYLKGLIENCSSDASQTKLFSGILGVLEQIDDGMDDMNDRVEDLNDFVESIDDALTAIEEDGDFDFSAHPDDDDFDDEDVDFDGDDNFEEKLHVVHSHPESSLMINGRLCSECHRLFLVEPKWNPQFEYVCPYCGKKMLPDLIDPDDLPVVSPIG